MFIDHIDIINGTINRTVNQGGFYPRSDLRALALTCRRFAKPCQRILFRTIQLDTPQMVHRFYLSLIYNPELANFVKVLQVADDLNENWVMYDEALPILLRTMVQVEDFSLNNFTKCCYALSPEDAMDYESDDDEEDESEDKLVGDEIVWRQRWTYLPQETQAAFMQIFSLPSLRQLSVAELSDIPMSFFGTIGNLERLALLDVTFRDVEGFEVNAIFACRRSFHTLEIGIDNADEQFNHILWHPLSYFATVSRLVVRISNVGQEHNATIASQIMRKSASTLKHIVWNEQSIRSFFPKCTIPIAFQAPDYIENLTFKMDLAASESEAHVEFNWRIFKLTDILLNQGIRRSMRLLKICVKGIDEIENLSLFADAPCWKPLDNLLAASEVAVEVILYTKEKALIDQDERWKEILGGNMPLLQGQDLFSASIDFDGNEYYSGY
ncbi:hypothetical protein Hypma_004453 [Hypsizygus marmoreus]|uniref:F-box domain-containing protein n=1 Tax=Hypsizygus marmoreus TaxID=39966 RepID=A0A369K0U2_HYPMA|nr:hypothetical protein Hypma_004453 [Hypsizygus marmoreus]